MHKPPLIALLSDFGLDDPFVGVMKGVIASICRESKVVDLTHAISPQNVRQAAFHLDRSIAYFPEGTVFACIVDPGVGTGRRPIAVEAGGLRFVAPDNGLLTPVFDRWPDLHIFLLNDSRFHLPSPSATFHGRDIFSPVASHIASGVPLDELGPRIDPATCSRIQMCRNQPLDEGRAWKGEVVAIDHFGNIVTSFESTLATGHATWNLSAGSAPSIPLLRTYGDVDAGRPLAYAGSSGMIEIAIRNGSASRNLQVSEETPVYLFRV